MLDNDLLLDSARPFGDSSNRNSGCPKSSSAGVPLSWYALRVSYSRVLKIQSELQGMGVRTFVPMMWKRCPVKPGMTQTGKSGMTQTGKPGMTQTGKPGMTQTGKPGTTKLQKKLVPAVSNLCFVQWTQADVERYIQGYGDKSPVHFYWDRTSSSRLVVPDKAMEDFIKVSSSMDEDLIYITEISEKLREGQTVMVKNGPFQGVEGKVVRIRKSRRVLVELPGMLAVATTFVSPADLEII